MNLASSSGPFPPEERPGTHCFRIFHYIFREKLGALPCPYVEDYSNQEYRAFLDSAMIQLAEPYYFLDVAIVQQKVTNRFTKRAISSYTIFVDGLWQLRLEHDRPLQQSRRIIQP